MPWIKLDDHWIDHPKIIRAGKDARDMWLASITWCARHLTDGQFPKELLPALAVMAGVDVANCQQLATALLDVRLWDATDTCYLVHDYLDYNPSKEQAEATKTARSRAGSAGGRAKASKIPGKPLAKSKQNPAPYPYPYPIEGEKGAEAQNQPMEGLPEQPEGKYALYEQVFIEETKLPVLSGGPQRWFDGLQQIVALGATPEDFRQAIRAQVAASRNGRNYNNSSPVSFVTATANVVAKRNAKPPAAIDPAQARLEAARRDVYGT